MATTNQSAASRPRSSGRRERERLIVDSARALFDERGVQDGPIEAIAQAVGINRTLIYRYFESKEELFVLTATRYLDEMTARGRAAVDPQASPVQQLRACWQNFTDYCLEFPAFLDCAMSLMRHPAAELRERVSERTWLRLGQSMAECLEVTVEILRAGAETGAFRVDDPAWLANCLYTQTLGMMHMARLGVGVARAAPGVPRVFPLAPEQVSEACLQAALAAVGAAP